jgi:hypothetical protein
MSDSTVYPVGLRWSASGCAILHGPLLGRFEALDDRFRHWGRMLGAEDHRFPALISLAELAPVRYLESFPQLATLAAPIQAEQLATCARAHGSASAIHPEDAMLATSTHLLVPAACYHIYPWLAGEDLAAPRFVTTVCACHRRERHYVPLRRQWSFNMREIVCVGDDAAVRGFVAAAHAFADACAAAFELDVHWQAASDPFFDPTGDSRALAQRLAPTKQELCLGDGLAIASVNQHRAFFGEAYDIRAGGKAARSACIAFGLERWLSALTARHGAEPADWPDPGLEAVVA